MSHSAENSEALGERTSSYSQAQGKAEPVTRFGVVQEDGGYLDVVDKSKTGQALRFKDVTMTVKLKKGHKCVLDSVTGSVESGELCALIGPSGAGKTSLMDVLKGKIAAGISEKSAIELNGAPLTRAIARKKIAFVAQDDALFATSTVREALFFSARLRLPRSTSDADVHKVVEDVMVKLGLTGCADSTIGNIRVRGLSGGERKRTSIAVELVTNPSVLFLDEPTSGLDSYAALETVKLLKSLADMGCVVLCSIHQPSSAIFSAFDKVLLMAQGKMIYGGKRQAMLKHFGALGHECPAQYNPADFVLFMAQTSSTEAIATFEADWRPKDPNSSWDASKAASKAPATEDTNAGAGTAGFATQMMLIASRDWKDVVRNKPALYARFGMTAFLNCLFGCIFYNAGRLGDTPDDARTHFGAVAQILIGAMFGSANPVLLAFPLERPVFLREYSTATYGLLPYFLSKTAVELVLGFLTMSVAILVPYWIMDLQGSVILHILAAFALSSVAASTALVLGCATKDVKVALELSPLIFVPQILFAGFFIKMEQIPDLLRWAQYLCSLKFAMNLALIVEFGGDAGCPDGNNTQQCQTSKDLLEENDIDEDDWWVYTLVLVLLFIVFRIVAATCLASKAHG